MEVTQAHARVSPGMEVALCAPDSTSAVLETSHRNMASTRRTCASSTARRMAWRAAEVTCPEKGPYTSSARLMPAAGTFTLTATCMAPVGRQLNSASYVPGRCPDYSYLLGSPRPSPWHAHSYSNVQGAKAGQ